MSAPNCIRHAENILSLMYFVYTSKGSTHVRCTFDGALMNHVVHVGNNSINEGAFPVYQFICPVCGNEDEIS